VLLFVFLDLVDRLTAGMGVRRGCAVAGSAWGATFGLMAMSMDLQGMMAFMQCTGQIETPAVAKTLAQALRATDTPPDTGEDTTWGNRSDVSKPVTADMPQGKTKTPEHNLETAAGIRALLTDPKRWSVPEKVWEFDEPYGGAYIPIDDTTFVQQNRGGGKIRLFEQTQKAKVIIINDQDERFDAELHDVKFFDGVMYALIMKDKDLYTARCDDLNARKVYLRVQSKLHFHGARDTAHALLYNRNHWRIFGRLRAVDWDTDNPVLKDRRGVRQLTSDAFDGDYSNSVYFDPAKEQPNYATSQIRYDYYSTRATLIEGIEVLGISCFAKNDNRKPSTRPDRITGTGPIYPIFSVAGEILSHGQTIVPLHLHARRTVWKEAHPYEPEVGQVYCHGITYDEKTRLVSVYYNHRYDTHYLVNADTAQSLPNCRVFRIRARL